MVDDRRIDQMQRRIDQLAVETWNNEPELASTYTSLVRQYTAQDLDTLDVDDIHYLLGAATYIDDAAVANILDGYAATPSISTWAAQINNESTSWENVQDRFDIALDWYDTYIGVDMVREQYARHVIRYELTRGGE